jgi:hypothetical protein
MMWTWDRKGDCERIVLHDIAIYLRLADGRVANGYWYTNKKPVGMSLNAALDELWDMRHVAGREDELWDMRHMAGREGEPTLLELCNMHMQANFTTGHNAHWPPDTETAVGTRVAVLRRLVAAGLWHERDGRYYPGPAPEPGTVTLDDTKYTKSNKSWRTRNGQRVGNVFGRALDRIAELERAAGERDE